MSTYLIKYRENKISIFEYEETGLIVMRNKGESSWKFENSSFWNWFKEKIEYEGEKLSFIVLCKDEFEINNSIKISDEHGLSQKQMEDILYDEDLSKFDIFQFPNQYKINDIKSSIQNRKQVIQKEYEKEKQLEDLNSQKIKLNENLIDEQKKQKKTDDNKSLLLKRLESIKKEYTTTLNNKKDDYIPLIANSAKEFTLKAVKFIVVYASSNDEKDASQQAYNKDEFILLDNKKKYKEKTYASTDIPGFLSNPHPLAWMTDARINRKEKTSTKEKISIKLDEKISLTVNENIDEKDILNQFNIFFKNNFTSLNALYCQFLEDIDIINKNYTDKIIKITSQVTKIECKKLIDENIFFDNTFHRIDTSNIAQVVICSDESSNKVSDYRKLLDDVVANRSPGLSSLFVNLQQLVDKKQMGNLTSILEQQSSDKLVISPDNIIKLLQETISKVDDKIIKSQNEIQASINQQIPKKDDLLKEEVSGQMTKIKDIQDKINTLNKQINALS
jgi:hypothetical protein